MKAILVLATVVGFQILGAILILPVCYAAEKAIQIVGPWTETGAALLAILVFVGYIWLVWWMAGKLFRRRHGLH